VKIITLVLALLIYGCADIGGKTAVKESNSRVNIGRVIDVKYVPESFATWAKTEVETDKGFFVLKGIVYVMKGDQTTMVTYNNGTKYMCFSSSGDCRKMWGSRN